MNVWNNRCLVYLDMASLNTVCLLYWTSSRHSVTTYTEILLICIGWRGWLVGRPSLVFPREELPVPSDKRPDAPQTKAGRGGGNTVRARNRTSTVGPVTQIWGIIFMNTMMCSDDKRTKTSMPCSVFESTALAFAWPNTFLVLNGAKRNLVSNELPTACIKKRSVVLPPSWAARYAVMASSSKLALQTAMWGALFRVKAVCSPHRVDGRVI
jgi:hypothetical protein